MIATVPHVAVVKQGQTLSGIAQQHGLSLGEIESDNPQITDPNVIVVGEQVYLVPGLAPSAPVVPVTPQAQSPSSLPVQPAQAPSQPLQDAPAQQPQAQPVQQSQTPVQQQSAPTGGGSGEFHIPGMSQSMTNCIAYRESTSGTNPAAHGNVFGIIPASGHNVSGDSLAQQEQVAGQIYASSGGQAWAADGCPGT